MRDSGMGQKILSKFSFVSFQSVWLRLCFDFDFFTLSESVLMQSFFWSVLLFIRAEYGHLLELNTNIYSVNIRI